MECHPRTGLQERNRSRHEFPVRRMLVSAFLALRCAACRAARRAADAADIVRGKKVYTTSSAPPATTPAPIPGPDFIMTGAGDPAVIRVALRTVAEMEAVRGRSVDATDVAGPRRVSRRSGSACPPPPQPPRAPRSSTTTRRSITTSSRAIADEITKLDNGTFVGWTRTGPAVQGVQAAAGTGLSAVCRFFSTAFAPEELALLHGVAPASARR